MSKQIYKFLNFLDIRHHWVYESTEQENNCFDFGKLSNSLILFDLYFSFQLLSGKIKRVLSKFKIVTSK